MGSRKKHSIALVMVSQLVNDAAPVDSTQRPKERVFLLSVSLEHLKLWLKDY